MRNKQGEQFIPKKGAISIFPDKQKIIKRFCDFAFLIMGKWGNPKV